MIEVEAMVSSVDGNRYWVQSMPDKACSGCSQSAGCSTSVLNKMVKRQALEVVSEFALNRGDKVLIGVDEGKLIQGSALVYLLPLLALFLGAGLGLALSEWITAVDADLLSAVTAFIFLFIVLLFNSKLQFLLLSQSFISPVVIKKL